MPAGISEDKSQALSALSSFWLVGLLEVIGAPGLLPRAREREEHSLRPYHVASPVTDQ